MKQQSRWNEGAKALRKIGFPSLIVLACLSGCGGGGGGADIKTTQDFPSNLQLTVPNPTYQSGSPELQMFNEINLLRKSLGLGLLAQNTNLDTAAFNHADYMASNYFDSSNTPPYTLPDGSVEIRVAPGFSGMFPTDRANRAGYHGSVSEINTIRVTARNSISPPSPVAILLNNIEQRINFLDQCNRDIGIGQAVHVDKAGAQYNPYVIVTGTAAGCQTNAANFAMHYPISGQTDVPVSFYSDFPETHKRSGTQETITYSSKSSFPISVTSVPGSILTVKSMTVTPRGSSTPLVLNTVSNATFNQMSKNWLFFIGDAALQSQTTYDVVFVGEANGFPINQTWSFKTM